MPRGPPRTPSTSASSASRARAGCSSSIGKKSIAALVPVDDEAFVEELEDAVDARDARHRLAEMKRTGEKGVPFEKVCKELGLE